MGAALEALLVTLFLLVAPGLLLIRLFRPSLLPRPALLALAALLGGATFYAYELAQHAEMSEFAQRIGLFDQVQPAYGEQMVSVPLGPRPVHFVLGAILELIYLLLLLVPYGIIQIVRSRRRTTSRVTA
jgi:hypothetical protein